MGPTDPNRYHMWTGWVGNDGSGGGPDMTLVVTNLSTQPVKVFVLDRYKGKTTIVSIGAGATSFDRRSLSNEWGWYDLLITTDADAGIAYHFAGHVENGRDSISDPGIGAQHGL
jgi:phospholipase C